LAKPLEDDLWYEHGRRLHAVPKDERIAAYIEKRWPDYIGDAAECVQIVRNVDSKKL
jgi:hypothetical protein